MTPAHVQFLDALAKAVCRAPLDGPGADADRPVRGRWPQAKRELILSTAADLFHRRGYAGTSMAEIGERVGMSGSAVYRYHPTKADLLSAVISRALNVLQLQLSEALAASEDAVDALGRLVDSYIGFAVRNPSLVGILLSEARNVADDEALAVRRTQREYLAEWEHLLQECRSDLTSAQARILVQAVLSVVNDATRTAALQRESNLAANLALISRLILGIDA
jgi:AcrR family transcriptional regulator